MPRKSDSIAINNPKLDRRVKLTPEQKVEIKELYEAGGVSHRQLAKAYSVSKRTIQFIVNPEAHKKNLERRAERGGSKAYYVKEKHTAAIRDHRDYKKQLYKDGLIGNVKEEVK